MVALLCMPTEQIVQLLLAERDRLNAAIELLGGTTTKRRGRPPGSKNGATAASTVTVSTPKKRGRRTFTAAQRKAQAARMKAYWAAKRRASR
jgi:hypothetical protein